MSEVQYTDLIITCEACGSVKKFVVSNQSEAEKEFKEFKCSNGCGRNLYSFITLGTLQMNELEPPDQIEEKAVNAPAEK